MGWGVEEMREMDQKKKIQREREMGGSNSITCSNSDSLIQLNIPFLLKFIVPCRENILPNSYIFTYFILQHINFIFKMFASLKIKQLSKIYS